MVSRKSTNAILVAAAASVAVLMLISEWFDRNGATRDPVRVQGAQSAEVTTTSLDQDTGTGRMHALGDEPEPVPSTSDGGTDAGTDPVPLALEPESIRLTIESTLAGQMDPGAFLDMALALSKLEVSEKANPLPDVSGAIRYPILGTPDGVTAELMVSRSGNPDFASPVLSYQIKLAVPDMYVSEGARRIGLETQITLWTDRDQQVKNFAVVTDSQVSRDSRDLGLGLEGRVVPTGMHFSCSAGSPFEWQVKNFAIDNYKPTAVDSALPITGHWPRPEDLGQLKNSALNQFGKL